MGKNIQQIGLICKSLRNDALAVGKPFIAHLLDMVIHECSSTDHLPMDDLVSIASQMRAFIESEELSDHSNELDSCSGA